MDLPGDYTAYSAETVEKDIRDFFRAERKRLKLNQEDVAEAGGIEQSTISKIERDPPYDPGLRSFLRAIRGLGMSASDFFGRFERYRAGLSNPPAPAQYEEFSSPRSRSSSLKLTQPLSDHQRDSKHEAPDGRAVPPAAVVVTPDQFLELGRSIGRAIRDAARPAAPPGARARKPKRRPSGTRRA
jgi:transcriptional regulator with XRE-family HTH domain